VKLLLFIFNLIFAISGIGIITAGAVVLADVGEFSHFMETRMLAPPIVLIVAGTIIFLIAFLGCFGAIRESYPMFMAFAVCLLIIFVIELAVGIAAAVYKNDFEDALRDSLRQSMTNYSRDSSEKAAWDNVQSKLMCCGTDGIDDWRQNNPPSVPNSCCRDFNNNAASSGSSCSSGSYYQNGCLGILKSKVREKSTILIGVGIGIAFIQILGIVLACLLAATIKREDGK